MCAQERVGVTGNFTPDTVVKICPARIVRTVVRDSLGCVFRFIERENHRGQIT
jgi:hypothetical protein